MLSVGCCRSEPEEEVEDEDEDEEDEDVEKAEDDEEEEAAAEEGGENVDKADGAAKESETSPVVEADTEAPVMEDGIEDTEEAAKMTSLDDKEEEPAMLPDETTTEMVEMTLETQAQPQATEKHEDEELTLTKVRYTSLFTYCLRFK